MLHRRLNISGVTAEIQYIDLREPKVLDELPGRVRKSFRYDASY
jgi:hypothetical protein